MDENIKNTTSSKLEYLKYFIGLMAIFTPCLYLIGIAFHQGLLSAYGIELSFFPATLHDVYVNIYHFFYYIFIKDFNFLRILLIVALCSIILLIVFSIPPLRCKLLSSFRKKFSSHNSFQNNTSNKLVLCVTSFLVEFFQNICSNLILLNPILKKISIFLLCILLVSICLISLVRSAYERGEEHSLNERKDYLENGCIYKNDSMSSNCKSLVTRKGKTLHTGILITSTNEYIAFFNCNGSVGV